MVYCSRCGTKNDDNARTCVKCGGALYSSTEKPEHYRRMEDECFGIPRGGTIVGLAIGLIIVIWGAIWFLQQTNTFPGLENVSLWSLFWATLIVIVGVLIIAGAVYRRRRY